MSCPSVLWSAALLPAALGVTDMHDGDVSLLQVVVAIGSVLAPVGDTQEPAVRRPRPLIAYLAADRAAQPRVLPLAFLGIPLMLRIGDDGCCDGRMGFRPQRSGLHAM